MNETKHRLRQGKHTPGPWIFSAYTNDVCNYEVFAKGVDGAFGPLVAGEYGVVEEEDARLIAASPDLLHALQVIVDTLDALGEMNNLQQIGKAAIAKALGQTD